MTLTATQLLEGQAARSQTRAPESAQEAQARRVAAEFEALLLTQLTSALRPKGEDEEGVFSSGGSSELYGQMFDEQMARVMARGGGVGLAETILNQLRLAGKRTEPHAAGRTTEPLTHSHSGRTHEAAPVTKPAHDRLRRAFASVKEEANYPAGRDPRTDLFVVSVAGEDAAPAATTGAGGSTLGSQLPPATRPRRVFPVEAPAATPGTPAAPAAHPHGEVERRVELQMPVRGNLRSNFGYRRDPFTGHRKYHSGVDIAAPRGTPIGAAAEGVVLFAGRDGGYGNCVVIEHADGRRTRYAHAERLHVRAGERVGAGQVIADVGSTGRSTGPHLHFEVIEGGRHKNPLGMLINDIALARR